MIKGASESFLARQLHVLFEMHQEARPSVVPAAHPARISTTVFISPLFSQRLSSVILTIPHHAAIKPAAALPIVLSPIPAPSAISRIWPLYLQAARGNS
jgi:hypothetical protein